MPSTPVSGEKMSRTNDPLLLVGRLYGVDSSSSSKGHMRCLFPSFYVRTRDGLITVNGLFGLRTVNNNCRVPVTNIDFHSQD
jgi:hypothetical protein